MVLWLSWQMSEIVRNNKLESFISGMWAENDSDEEDSRRGFGGGKKQADYSAPMNFVSGGLKEGDKGKNREHNEPGDDDVTIISSTKAKVGIFLVVVP